MRFHLFAIVAVVCATVGESAPVIARNGIVQAATLAAPGLPNAAIAQGSLFSIYGSGLGPATFRTADAYPLRTDLGGVTVTAAQGKTTVNVIPVFVSAGQINAILPSNTPIGLVAFKVTYITAKRAAWS